MVLPVPEMENLLSPEVVHSVIVSWTTVKRGMDPQPIAKLSDSELGTKKIGDLIDTTILKDLGKVKKFAAPNGSLKPGDKYDFCTRALPHITPTNLSAEVVALVEKVLQFIVQMSQHS